MRRTLNRRIILVIICSFSGILMFVNIFNSTLTLPSSRDLDVRTNRTLSEVVIEPAVPTQFLSEQMNNVSTKVTLERTTVRTEDEVHDDTQLEVVTPAPAEQDHLPWYFANGDIRPTPSNQSRNAF